MNKDEDFEKEFADNYRSMWGEDPPPARKDAPQALRTIALSRRHADKWEASWCDKAADEIDSLRQGLERARSLATRIVEMEKKREWCAIEIIHMAKKILEMENDQ